MMSPASAARMTKPTTTARSSLHPPEAWVGGSARLAEALARRALGAGLAWLEVGRGRRRCHNRKPGGGAVHAARSASIARRGERRCAPSPASQTKAAPRAGAKTASAGALA